MSRVLCVVTVFCWGFLSLVPLGCVVEQRRLCLWLSAHSYICSSNSSGACWDQHHHMFVVTSWAAVLVWLASSCCSFIHAGVRGRQGQNGPRILLLRASLSTILTPLWSPTFSSPPCWPEGKNLTYSGSNLRAAPCCSPSQGTWRAAPLVVAHEVKDLTAVCQLNHK